MKANINIFSWSSRVTNTIIGLVGIVFILIAIIVGTEKIISVVMLSVGASILASAIVGNLSTRYLIQQNDNLQTIERWGISGIYEARSEINTETNNLLLTTKKLEICAMGLKGFRDAQSKTIEQCVARGMILRILTLDPSSKILSEIDRTEGLSEGSTRATIISLIDWIEELKKKQLGPTQVELKIYDHYPYDFYFCMDGTVFTGPYHTKTSQQTITYKFSANTLGANTFKSYYESLWENANYV